MHLCKTNLSTAFAGQTVGITEVADQIWMISFMHYDLGFLDNEKGRVEPAHNPFTPEKVLTMSPEYTQREWRPRQDSNLRPAD